MSASTVIIPLCCFRHFPGQGFLRRQQLGEHSSLAIIGLVEFPPSVPLLLTVTFPSPRSPLPFTRRVPLFTVVPPL